MGSLCYVRIGVGAGVAAMLLGACSGSGPREADLPDSAQLQAPADPPGAPQPAQTESPGTAGSQSPTGNRTPPAQPATPQRGRPILTAPPDARDIRPSIPYPPDTLTRRDTL